MDGIHPIRFTGGESVVKFQDVRNGACEAAPRFHSRRNATSRQGTGIGTVHAQLEPVKHDGTVLPNRQRWPYQFSYARRRVDGGP